MPTFESPLPGQLELNTWPDSNRNSAQPWNAADHYLLAKAPQHAGPVLVINDTWGALSCGLSANNTQVYCYTDSFCSQQAIRTNKAGLEQQQSSDQLAPIELIEDLTCLIEQNISFSAVLIQQPKSFDSLQYWLQQLTQLQLGTTPILIAGMAKHFPVKWLNWLEQHCLHYNQFQIEKKARLVSFQLPDKLPDFLPLKGYEYQGSLYQGLPGVFCRDHLDIGSQVLLDHLPDNIAGHLIDLGCGNGLLAKEIKKAFPDIDLTLCDDSAVAIHSARLNLKAGDIDARFCHTDVLNGIDTPADWIICNPPFHKGNQVLTDIAQRMFYQASQQLRKNGKLLVIANRHLPYGKDLKRHFGGYQSLFKDGKFTLYLCHKR